MLGRMRGWTLVLGCMLLVVAGCATKGSSVYGKHLVRSDDLSPEVLARFKAFNAKPKGQPGIIVDTEDWKGDVLRASSQANPYRIVVTLRGIAEHPGDVTARVDSGWGLGDGMTRLLPTPHVRKADARAGESIELVSVSSPLSFKDDRDVMPQIGFAGTTNFIVDSIHVEVWSGLGRASWFDWFRSITVLLTGLAFLCLALWWRSR